MTTRRDWILDHIKIEPTPLPLSTKPSLLHFPPLLSLPICPISSKFPSKLNLSDSPSSSHIPSSIAHHGRPRYQASSRVKAEANNGPLGLEEEDLSPNGPVYRNTLRLVECSMFAASAGLIYFLSNSLSIENYFGCFLPLRIVLSSMRWGITAGRKTMVATAVLSLVLSGPLKALTYLLTHGILGFAIGSFWRLGASWSVAIFLCMLVRAVGALGYVTITSFLIKENILDLITINLHATIAILFTASGINSIPSMNLIYTIFGVVLLLNSIFLVYLLHLLYSVFLTRLGMRSMLNLPRWLQKAI